MGFLRMWEKGERPQKSVGEGRRGSEMRGRIEKTSDGGGRKTKKISGRWEKREENKREEGEM